MKKRIVFAVMAALMLSVIGCKKAETKSTPTLIWWLIGNTLSDLQDSVKIISDYTEEKIGVRLDIRQAGWGDAAQRFNTIVNSGEYFDILFTDSGTYNRFVSLGAFADITDLLPKAAPKLYNYIPSLLWDGVRVKNRIYAVPTYKDSSATIYIYWDEKFVQKYNIDTTQNSYSYLDQVFRRIKQGEGQRFYPYPMAKGTNPFLFEEIDNLSSGLEFMGVDWQDQSRRVISALDDPRIIERLRYRYAWNQAGIINPDANIAENETKGKPFMMAQAWPSVAIPYARDEGIEKYIPVKYFGPIYSTGSIQGSMNAISANSRYKEEALKFLEFVNTDDKLRDMLHWGIEGKHFQYVNGGTAVHMLADWSLANYQIGSYFIGTSEDTSPPGYWDEVRAQNDSATPSVMLGFIMDLEPVQTELANCRAVWDKYRFDLITGSSNPDVIIPQVKAELNNVGFDRVIAEAQRQVDAFASSK